FAPPLVCSGLSLTRLAAPHAGAAGSGGSWSPSFCADFERLTAVACRGVQPGTSCWKTQTDNPTVQEPSRLPSTSQAGSPSWQSTPIFPLVAFTSAVVTCHSA